MTGKGDKDNRSPDRKARREGYERIWGKKKTQRKRIKPSSCKAKGRLFQQEICRYISEITGEEYDQQSDQSNIRSREMGQSGVDIVIRGTAVEKFPFAIECKNVEKLNWWDAISQAKKNVTKCLPHWLLFVRRNRTQPVVVMDCETLWWLLDRKFAVQESYGAECLRHDEAPANARNQGLAPQGEDHE